MTQTIGERVRSLRLDRGLSQAQLGGSELSASYVSLLEAGKRQVSNRILETLARRLGTTASYLQNGVPEQDLREFWLRLRYSQLALANGEAADAESSLRALLDDEASLPDELPDEVRWSLAQALEAQGKLEEAVAVFEAIWASNDGTIPAERRLQAAVSLVRCLREAGDIARSVDIGEAACRRAEEDGLAVSDVGIQLVSTLAGCYYLRGDLFTASRVAELAISRAEALGSRRARGSAYWNASVVAQTARRHGDALRLAEKALHLFAEDGDDRAAGRAHILTAWVLLRQDRPRAQRALQALNKASQLLHDSGSQVDLAYCETERARAMMLLGRMEDAAKAAQRALEMLAGEGPRVETATAQVVLARLQQEDPRAAKQLLHTAAQTLTALEASREAAAIWSELAELYAEAGDVEAALGAYRAMAANLGVPAVVGARAPRVVRQVPAP